VLLTRVNIVALSPQKTIFGFKANKQRRALIMRKTDKKIENSLRQALTEACETALVKYEGFQWLTHFVNYGDFPASLLIVCVYDTNAHLAKTDKEGMRALIKEKLASIGIKMKDCRQQVRFDTEEDCDNDNDGRWNERFR